VVRYGLEAKFKNNKAEMFNCDLVFIAVPTPITPKDFDDNILRKVLPLIGKGKVAVIKSTVIIGHTRILQAANPGHIVIHSPEFLSEKTVAYDVAHPDRNIVGIPKNTLAYRMATRFTSLAGKISTSSKVFMD
jgi:UDP-glucose 6-dehydrogenase